jgi:hypothetical protein
MTITRDDILNAFIRKSTGAWMETYGKIWGRDRTKGLITPKLNFLQRKIQRVIEKLEDMELPIRILGLKPRARGSTTYFTALGYTLMRRTPTSAVFIGGQSDQTVGLWNMLKTYHANDRFDWGNTGEVNEKGAIFTNGSRAKKETAKDVQAGIGDTYQLLHATEAARWSQYGVANAADVMANILKAVPMLPHTYVFLESTAEFASGDFYERWIGAIDADDFLSDRVVPKPGDYIRVFASWFEFEESLLPGEMSEEERRHIELTLDAEEWYQGEKELKQLYGVTEDGVTRLGTSVTCGDWIDQIAWRRYAIEKECKKDLQNFWRDYPHSWQDAFLKAGNTRFNQAGLAVARKRLQTVVPLHGIIEEGKNGRAVAFRQSSQGEAVVTIFEKPKNGCKYILSVDPMTGITQTGGKEPDRHGVFVMRAGYWNEKGKWCRPATAARIVQCRFDIDVLEVHVWRLARYYGGHSGCMIAVEVNMDRGIIELLKLRGANLYAREIFNRRDYKTTEALGFQTNERTREAMVETLASAIREYDAPGHGIDIWCPQALEQCENFVRKKNGRSEAADGHKDDDVIAIALGLELIEHATPYFIQQTAASAWFQPPSRSNVQAGPGAYS